MRIATWERNPVKGDFSAPLKTRFNPNMKPADPAAAKRYRYIAIVGMHSDNPLPLEINMLLTHEEATTVYNAMKTGELWGGWGRLKMDIAYDLGMAAVKDMGLRMRLRHILSDYIYNTHNIEELEEIGALMYGDTHGMRNDCELISRDFDDPCLSVIIQFLIMETNVISYYIDSLELVEEPLDEYDFLCDCEEWDEERFMEERKMLAHMLHPELFPELPLNETHRTITVIDAAGHVFKNIRISYSEYRKVDIDEGRYNLRTNTVATVASFLADYAAENPEYGQTLQEAEELWANTLNKARNMEMFSADSSAYDRDAMSKDELADAYYNLLRTKLMSFWKVKDDTTGEEFLPSMPFFEFPDEV